MDSPDALPPVPHMSSADFRAAGHDLIDWIADYRERLAALPVSSSLAPGDVRARMPAAAPEQPEPFEGLLADLDRVVVPGLLHWQSPRFFGYFPANASLPSVLGELASAGLGVQGMLWSTSPACTEVETHMLDWLADLLGLAPAFRSDGTGGGVLQDSASSSVLCALIAARERATAGAANRRGAQATGRTLVAYASTQAHSSIEKAVRIAGIGSDNLRLVPVDAALALDADALAAQIAADRAAGLEPFFVCASVGTTSTEAIDPVPAIAAIAEREGLWLHVDAAMLGVAALCPEHRDLLAGCERADSLCTNAHKWLLVNFDASLFWVRDRRALVGALSIMPEYLANPASDAGAVLDYRDWQVPLGRRFRALKVWWVLRTYGAEGLRALIRLHVALTADLAARAAAHPRLALAAPPGPTLVCIRHVDGDAATQALLDGVNADGRAFITHTRIDGRLVARLALGSAQTQAADVEALWAAVAAHA